MIVGEGVRLGLAGLVLGLGAALAATRLLGGLLFEVRATDPPTFLGVAAALAAVVVAASWLPARRALRLEPRTALDAH
jgi:putative ABC transport system permease protein